MDNTEKVKKIIEENIYCTIAMTSLDGKPWVSPVFFVYDENYNIYWVSNKNSEHSRLLRVNPQAAIVIFDSQAPEGAGDGVYIKARVEELSNEEEIKEAIKFLNKRVTKEKFRVKGLGEVTADGVWRIYKALPETISTLTEGEYINGQYVDKRVEINL